MLTANNVFNYKTTIIMKKFIFFTLVTTLLFSCSPQKRLDNLLRKNPELIQDSVLYNVNVKDTLYLNYSFADSVIFVKDTVFEPTIIAQVKTQNAQATLVQNPDKSLRLVAEALPDTIIQTIEKPVYIPKVIYHNKAGKMTNFQRFFFLSGGLVWSGIALIILSMIFFRIFKP